MSSLLLALARENPWPGIAVASLNLVVALLLMGVSLLLGVVISVLAWVHALADREPAPSTPPTDGASHDPGTAARSRWHHLLGQRLARASRMHVQHDRIGARPQRRRA